MTAIGKRYVATLSTNERGPVERRPATTLSHAFAEAHWLLHQAQGRIWDRGETVSVTIVQSDE
jgi:hypothetical protein